MINRFPRIITRHCQAVKISKEAFTRLTGIPIPTFSFAKSDPNEICIVRHKSVPDILPQRYFLPPIDNCSSSDEEIYQSDTDSFTLTYPTDDEVIYKRKRSGIGKREMQAIKEDKFVYVGINGKRFQ